VPDIDVRPEVAAFALLMEKKLRENDHKGGWIDEDVDWLFTRLEEEAGELYTSNLTGPTEEDRKKIGEEAADVANFAMMIADVTGALKHAPTYEGRTWLERRKRDPLVAAVRAIAADVLAERRRQRKRYPTSERMPDGTGGGGRETWARIAKNACERADREGRLTHADVFDEETGEVLEATDPDKLETELIQVAAVCFKWIEDLRERKRR
jgi:NTP pyrophosphatase (non-canonical NTP hydrolase)